MIKMTEKKNKITNYAKEMKQIATQKRLPPIFVFKNNLQLLSLHSQSCYCNNFSSNGTPPPTKTTTTTIHSRGCYRVQGCHRSSLPTGRYADTVGLMGQKQTAAHRLETALLMLSDTIPNDNITGMHACKSEFTSMVLSPPLRRCLFVV